MNSARVARHYPYQVPVLHAELVSGLDSLAYQLMKGGSLSRVFALAFAIWAVCGRPRWPGLVAVGLWLADLVAMVLDGIQ